MSYQTSRLHRSRVWQGVKTRWLKADPRHARPLGLVAIVCALATGLVVSVPLARDPATHLAGVVLIAVSLGGAVIGLTVLIRARRWTYGLTIAGLGLMALGTEAGAVMPIGLDAAAILPLAGALLTLPEQRGRSLAGMFVLAFFAGMAGESAAYLHGGTTPTVGVLGWPQSLVQSAVMLAIVYGLVWRVGDRWWSTTTRAQRALDTQRRLLEVSERLLATLDPQGVLDLIADSLKSLLAYDNLTIYRVDREAGALRPMEARDRFAHLIMGTTFPLGTGLTGWVAERGEALCVNDVHLDDRAASIPGTPNEPESLIVVPLLVKGEVVGTLNLGRMGKSEAHFSDSEFELVRLFAVQASIALHNAEAHRAAWNRAEKDSLTGLRNRGAFDARLETLGRDETRSCALIMLDLDGFKRYNDRHGHPAGDTVLQAVGQAIDSAIRARDTSFRLGGDEFAILLPRTRLGEAIQIADRVRSTIKSHPIVAGTITVSAGVACYPRHAADKASLVAAADAALYRAKAAGKNRTDAVGRRTRRAKPQPSVVAPPDGLAGSIPEPSSQVEGYARRRAATAPGS
jgi:diguanylate cyclase (GGDEF)-like protein